MRILPDSISETENQRSRRERIAFYIGVVTATLFVLLVGASQLLVVLGRPPLELSLVTPVFLVAAVLGTILSRRHRPVLGISIMLASGFFGVGYLISRNAGIGIALPITLTLVSVVLISQIWPRAWVSRGMIAAAVLGVLLIGIDIFWPTLRPPAPGHIQPFSLLLATAVLILAMAQLFRHLSDYSLQTKMIISFLMITLIPVMLLSMLNNRTTQQILTEDANLRLSAAASQTALGLDDFMNNGLDNIRTEAGIIAQSGFFEIMPAVRPGSAVLRDMELLLKAFRDKDPINILSYALLDTNGEVALQNPPVSGTVFESDRDFFTVPMANGRPYVSPVEFEPNNVQGYFYFSAPVIDDDNEILGVLRVRYKATVIQEQIARNTGLVGGQSFAVVFDENYLHLAHGTAPETIYKLVAPVSQERYDELLADNRLPDISIEEISTNLPELEAILDNIAESPFFEARDVATGERINQAAMVTMETQPWLVGFFQPRDVFLAPIQAQTRRAVLLAGLISAVVVAAAVVLSRLLTGPITRLAAVASQVAEGDLTAQAKVESEDEIGRLAISFNRMTARLAELIGGLEQRVFERTQALQTSTEVARQLSTILDRDQLLLEVVERVQAAFDYYHAHIYLYNEHTRKLVMAGGTGEAGKTMLANHHQIDLGKGLVGRAAQDNVVVLVPDVSREPGWLSNPLLTETKAEIAVPIALGDQVLGVLDVQHNVAGALTDADAELLQLVASQVAVALRNANLYAETQQRAARETLINEINQRIRSAKDVDEALQIAVRELGRAVGAPKTAVRLTPGKSSNGHAE